MIIYGYDLISEVAPRIEQGSETSRNAEHVQVATPEYHGTRAFTFDELVALLHRAREVDRVFTTADRFRFYCCLLFTGLRGVNAGVASIAVQLFVPFSAILAWAVFRERLRPLQILGMGVAFAGAYALVGSPRVAPNAFSFALVVAGAFMLAVATVQIKSLGRVNVFRLNAWVAV